VILTALRRGISRRCPHCGQGPLFSGWAHHLERCPVCGLVYERNPGDMWAFTIVGDRLPIAAIIVLIYLGYGRSHHVLGVITFAVLGGCWCGRRRTAGASASRFTTSRACTGRTPRIRSRLRV
jgi:uncharacterized protein (DUF983 family)